MPYKVVKIYFNTHKEDETVMCDTQYQATELIGELIKSPFSEGGAFQIKRIKLLEVVDKERMTVDFNVCKE